MPDSITLTREELYELVWTKPMARLAAEYAISDVGLAKLCARCDVPTPPRGYWAKKEAGKAPRRPRLPPSDDDSRIRLTPVGQTEGAPEHDELARAIAELKRPDHRIVVAERLQSPCALVKEANVALKEASVDQRGILERPRRCLDLRVSPAARARALRVADALLKACAERDWAVAIEDGATKVHVGEVPIGLAIEELLETVELPAKPDLSTDRYEFHYIRRETAEKPSGYLAVRLEAPEHSLNQSVQRNWRGSEKRPLEDRLNQVIVGILKLADAARAERVRRQRQEQARREQEQRRQAALAEQQRLRTALAQERANVACLRDQVARWRESHELRRFVEAVRERGVLQELGLEGQELAHWISWALRQADRLDPFTPSPPSILDQAEQIEGMGDGRRGNW